MEQEQVCRAIEEALKEQGYKPESLRHDIAFHMTDWLADLEAWHSYCKDPDSLDAEATEKLLMRFLVHVPNHVAAASKLLMEIPVSDVFAVGATRDEE